MKDPEYIQKFKMFLDELDVADFVEIILLLPYEDIKKLALDRIRQGHSKWGDSLMNRPVEDNHCEAMEEVADFLVYTFAINEHE